MKIKSYKLRKLRKKKINKSSKKRNKYNYKSKRKYTKNLKQKKKSKKYNKRGGSNSPSLTAGSGTAGPTPDEIAARGKERTKLTGTKTLPAIGTKLVEGILQKVLTEQLKLKLAQKRSKRASSQSLKRRLSLEYTSTFKHDVEQEIDEQTEANDLEEIVGLVADSVIDPESTDILKPDQKESLKNDPVSSKLPIASLASLGIDPPIPEGLKIEAETTVTTDSTAVSKWIIAKNAVTPIVAEVLLNKQNIYDNWNESIETYKKDCANVSPPSTCTKSPSSLTNDRQIELKDIYNYIKEFSIVCFGDQKGNAICDFIDELLFFKGEVNSSLQEFYKNFSFESQHRALLLNVDMKKVKSQSSFTATSYITGLSSEDIVYSWAKNYEEWMKNLIKYSLDEHPYDVSDVSELLSLELPPKTTMDSYYVTMNNYTTGWRYFFKGYVKMLGGIIQPSLITDEYAYQWKDHEVAWKVLKTTLYKFSQNQSREKGKDKEQQIILGPGELLYPFVCRTYSDQIYGSKFVKHPTTKEFHSKIEYAEAELKKWTQSKVLDRVEQVIGEWKEELKKFKDAEEKFNNKSQKAAWEDAETVLANAEDPANAGDLANAGDEGKQLRPRPPTSRLQTAEERKKASSPRAGTRIVAPDLETFVALSIENWTPAKNHNFLLNSLKYYGHLLLLLPTEGFMLQQEFTLDKYIETFTSKNKNILQTFNSYMKFKDHGRATFQELLLIQKLLSLGYVIIKSLKPSEVSEGAEIANRTVAAGNYLNKYKVTVGGKEQRYFQIKRDGMSVAYTFYILHIKLNQASS